MVCRDFILSEICKPCLSLPFFEFAQFILPYPHGAGSLPQNAQKDTAAAPGHGGRQSNIALVNERPGGR